CSGRISGTARKSSKKRKRCSGSSATPGSKSERKSGSVRPDAEEPARRSESAGREAENGVETVALLAQWREGYDRLADLSERQFSLVKDAVPAAKPVDATRSKQPDPKSADAVLAGIGDDFWREFG